MGTCQPAETGSADMRVADKIAEYQRNGDERTATELVQYFKPMVAMAARKIARNRPDLYEDLFQVGQMSLLRSLGHYDADVGTPFEGYAMKSLIGHMKNYLRDKSWYIQVPRRIKERGAQVQRAVDALTVRLGRSPGVGEIAEELGLTEEETTEILAGRDYYQIASLDVEVSRHGDGRTALGDLIAADSDDYAQVEHRIDLQAAVQRLDRQELRVLQELFIEGHSQRSVAAKLGVSQMSVSRIQRRAVEKLRRWVVPEHHTESG